MLTSEKIIKMLNMKPLPEEGGYYAETYRSDHLAAPSFLPDQYQTERSLSTAIYYLLTPDTKSLLHRLPTDEIFHFYLGDPVLMLQLFPDGSSKTLVLGPGLCDGHHVQAIVPKGVWQGSHLIEGGEFALMGTTMSPGFDFMDNEIGDRPRLLDQYPNQRDLITRLTD